jgi:hypothetical protein
LLFLWRSVAPSVLLASLACAPAEPIASEPAPTVPAPVPLRACRAAVRDDRTILVDDMPFFPIGLYYAAEETEEPSGQGLRDLRRMGFNMVFFHGGPSDREQLDRIAAAGLRVWYRPPGALYSQFEDLEHLVGAVRAHPALLFWEMMDEPVINQVSFEDTRRGCALVKRLDPDHPIVCVQWPDWKCPEELARWGRLCDIYAFDYYPLPLRGWVYQGSDLRAGFPHSIAIVGPLTEWWRSLAPGKPVVPVLQAWAWRPTVDGKDGYPSYQQGRFMAYQAVIAGASGLFFYGQVRANRPNTAAGLPHAIDPDTERAARDFARARELNEWFWSYERLVIAELAQMAPVFAAPDSPWAPEIEPVGAAQGVQPSLQWRAKAGGQGTTAVLLVVNASDYPATVRITARRFAGLPVYCWHEGRVLAADSAGAFVDRFDPYAVHVYSTVAQERWRP